MSCLCDVRSGKSFGHIFFGMLKNLVEYGFNLTKQVVSMTTCVYKSVLLLQWPVQRLDSFSPINY